MSSQDEQAGAASSGLRREVYTDSECGRSRSVSAAAEEVL